MKKIYLLFAALVISIACKAQHTNLTDDELFEGIKFNNVSLGDIMSTKGNLSQMRSLFGNNMQEYINSSAPYLAKELYNDSMSIGFEDETDSGNEYSVSFISVYTSSVLVTVKNLSISIGDDKSKFGRTIYNSDANLYVFIDEDTGSVSLSFKIDPATNKVTEIKFIAF